MRKHECKFLFSPFLQKRKGQVHGACSFVECKQERVTERTSGPRHAKDSVGQDEGLSLGPKFLRHVVLDPCENAARCAVDTALDRPSSTETHGGRCRQEGSHVCAPSGVCARCLSVGRHSRGLDANSGLLHLLQVNKTALRRPPRLGLVLAWTRRVARPWL